MKDRIAQEMLGEKKQKGNAMTERTDKERMDFIDKNAAQIVMDIGTQICGKGPFRLVLDDMMRMDELNDELITQENQPKPESGWVECAVTLGSSNAWMVECDNIPHLQTPRLSLYKAIGYKGFGGIRYAESPDLWVHWPGEVSSTDPLEYCSFCKKEWTARPITPEAVRFWVERGEK